MILLDILKQCGYSDIAEQLDKDLNDEKRRNFVKVLDEMYLRGNKEQFIAFFNKFWDAADIVYNEEIN
jgi:hypothetical protein